MGISKLPRHFKFTFPNGEEAEGLVVKEVGIEEKSDNEREMDYFNVIQLLETKKGEKWIRFGYYNKNYGQEKKDWRWGSQTTLTALPDVAKKLIKKAEEAGIL